MYREPRPLRAPYAGPEGGLALQLRFLRSSESIGHHDSEIVDDGSFDRDDAGALGVIAWSIWRRAHQAEAPRAHLKKRVQL